MLMRLIILSMNRACSHLAQTVIGSFVRPLQAEIVMLGSVITGTGVVVVVWGVVLSFELLGQGMIYYACGWTGEIMVMLCWGEEGDTTIFRFVMVLSVVVVVVVVGGVI